jgi:putative FmdB family regulatory protein
MPTYDYECDACEHKFELYQSITAPVETKCPQCKKKKLRRLIGTGGAIVFKGSGFYQTDYRSESYKKSASADSKSTTSASSDSKGSENKTSETKAASSDASNSSTSSSSGGSDTKPSTKTSKPKGKKGE